MPRSKYEDFIGRYKDEATKHGFDCIGRCPDRKRAFLYECLSCHTVRSAWHAHVRSGKITCQSCRDVRDEKEASASGLTLLKRFTRQSGKDHLTTAGRYLCISCDHEFDAVVSAVRAGNVKCRTCERVHRQEAAERVRLTFVYSFRREGCTRGLYKCDDCGGEFDADIGAVKRADVSCPHCAPAASSAERTIRDHLITLGANFDQQVSIRIGPSNRRFDFVLQDRIIEYDGEQHFNPNGQFSGNSGDFFKQSYADLIKSQYCAELGIPLVRIHFSIRGAGLLTQAVDLALVLNIDDPVYLVPGAKGEICVMSSTEFLIEEGVKAMGTSSF